MGYFSYCTFQLMLYNGNIFLDLNILMIKKVAVLIIISIFFILTTTPSALANHIGAFDICQPTDPTSHCITNYSCQPSNADPKTYLCQPPTTSSIFGKIQPPDALKGLISKDPTGAGGISLFLSNLVTLIYSLAAIVLLFMILWGAFDWMTSGGEKEKLESARNKIISSIIGIMLFAVAFAIIQILGQFTGFTFFVGQK